MNAPTDRQSRSTDPGYAFGIIGEALRNTIGITLATYFLDMIGTVLGLMAGSGTWDAGWFGDVGLLMLLVIPFVLVAGAMYPSVGLCALLVGLLWYVCLYSESLKQRLILLAIIFVIAFASGWYVGAQ
jgi:hypothetical protein